MALTFSTFPNNQEPNLYTSSFDCDGVDTYQDQSVLKPTINSRDQSIFANKLNDKSRSKSCFPRIISQPSIDVPSARSSQRSCRLWEPPHWKADGDTCHIKQHRTITWQKSCSGLAAAATVVIVEDVDSASDEEGFSDCQDGFDKKLQHLDEGNITQDRGRRRMPRGLPGGRQGRFRGFDYEDSVSPFSLGSRGSSSSETSAEDSVEIMDRGCRKGK